MEEKKNNSKVNILIGILAAVVVVLLLISLGVVMKAKKPAETAQEPPQQTETPADGEKEYFEEPSAEEAENAEEPSGDEAAKETAEEKAPEEEETEAVEGTHSSEGEEKVLHVIIETAKGKIYQLPLDEDLNLVLIDSQLASMPEEITLEEMGEMADPAQHDVNILRLKDGKIACIESNCDNQVCVGTGEISGDMFDLPIICLPHNAVISIE